ncbi:hypothetical protein KUV50_16810 [Membranicola marinus]|uniref:Uncharacterized protein n=1 Tax=Membranihabitans marinus TaxID=1227546 RepID=A0A953L8H1_9BACT|nr:hypothetical protein [Membranihabitans marinus]MBY5959817.1 hypothetical protein [Membranihabitans marinus]
MLIHSISDQQSQKELLNRILADDITSHLTTDHISAPVSRTEALMKIFDGQIQLPEDLEGKSIESVEDLKEQINRLEKEKSHTESLLPIARDL